MHIKFNLLKVEIEIGTLTIQPIATNATITKRVEGGIENPKPNSELSGPVLITGWAKANESIISEVAIYLNGGYRGSAKLGIYHPALGDRSGFRFEWPAQIPGLHTIQVQARTSAGYSKLLASVYEQVLTNIPVLIFD